MMATPLRQLLPATDVLRQPASHASPTGVAPIVQLHPTRRCNLACAHCYTSSGPQVAETLPLPLMQGALDDAAALGYGQLALSGGEPLLYEALPLLLRQARRLGMLTSVTSNGLLLTPARWEPLAPWLSRLAISVDGRAASHDRLRGQPGALDKTLNKLALPRASGTPFGFIFTLTQYNIDELEDVVQLAAEAGADSVQVHPLTLHGRATQTLADARPDAMELLAALIEAQRLAIALSASHGVQVHVDALSQRQLRAYRERLVPAWPAEPPGPTLSTLAPVLVLQADGQVLPLTHELPRSLWLGSLHEQGLLALAARWLAGPAPAGLVQACADTWAALTSSEQPAAYWYDEVAALAQRIEAPRPQPLRLVPRPAAAPFGSAHAGAQNWSAPR
ncbi:radical SAM protein [Paucibacter sp. APW11]|uniref:Radical SAM protein n=1 Tax=Roseateles aquae TaxID=3077235 RepID=A0ABU3PID3_9BURK|nr:radical SAM protein [Paucibacter sp. APW11]MDT9002318.1 radical SAM protein [Paucibacter sp. APW11]